MAEERGFSYESPEKQKKNAAKLFGFELSILIIVLIIILGILIYLGIIPLGKLFSGNFIETSKVGTNNGKGRSQSYDATPAPTKPVNAQLIIRSANSNYNIEVSDPNNQKIIEFIKRWPVYGRTYPGGGNKLIDTIELVLAPQPSNTAVVRSGDEITSSAKSSMNGNKLTYEIYLSENTLKEFGDKAGDAFISISLFTINRTVNNYDTGEELLKADNKMGKELENEGIVNSNLITLEEN